MTEQLLKDAVDLASRAQSQACDPEASVWVTANAGAGKTKVLVDRFLRLLLKGVPAYRILCLTFTRAAAAQMQNKLLDKLKEWVSDDEAILVGKLTKLLERRPTEDEKELARRLFASTLAAPGGLKIATIHGFCQSVLAQFPLEANIPPHFTVMDELQAETIKEQAMQSLLLTATGQDRDIINYMIAEMSDEKLQEVIEMLHSYRSYFDDSDNAKTNIMIHLGLDPDTCATDVLKDAYDFIHSHRSTLIKLLNELQQGNKSEQAAAQQLATISTLSADRWANIYEDVFQAFLTQDLKPRKKVLSNDFKERLPDLVDCWAKMTDAIDAYQQQLLAHEAADRTEMLYQFAALYFRTIDAIKKRKQVLDFDDLIRLTKRLLTSQESASWVLYKLDGGIDHILIDEAQDTNPDQWEIIRMLGDDFFSGANRSKTNRTLFAVGDVKQSIYKFQMADPAYFSKTNNYFMAQAKAVGHDWRSMTLDVSFRSAPGILRVVDRLFSNQDKLTGVYGDKTHHVPARKEAGGRVVLWPAAHSKNESDDHSWQLPTTRGFTLSSPAKTAMMIAHQIEHMLKSGEILASTQKPIAPQDILILMNKRTAAFTSTLISELKRKKIPIAGIDRLNLMAELVVEDLIALGEFVCQPMDDYALAVILKSPFIGLSDDDLSDLAMGRDDCLWAMLNKSKREDFKKAAKTLTDIMSYADHSSVYDFYADVLIRLGGQEKILRRLGAEALDPIQVFMDHVQSFSLKPASTLQQFVHDARRLTIDVKRDQEESGRNEIRLMTVHGSKGLEAPVVIIADATVTPQIRPIVLQHEGYIYWPSSKARDCQKISDMRLMDESKEWDEYHRLLYVAMTRAKDHLYITGWRKVREISDRSWYSLVGSVLQEMGRALPFDVEKLSSRSWTKDWGGDSQVQMLHYEEAASAISKPKEDHKERQAIKIPPWLYQKPDHVKGTEKPPAHRRSISGHAVWHGQLVHAVFERLTPETGDDVDALTHRVARHYFPQVSEDGVALAIATVGKLIAHPHVKMLLSYPAATEVPIIASLKGRSVSLRIDRLAETPDKVIVIDFKTGESSAEWMSLYRRQVRDYMAALARIYPHKKVEGYIIKTDEPFVVPVSLSTDLNDAA